MAVSRLYPLIIQNDYKMQQQIKKLHIVDNEKEVHNNPNLHSDEQDELKLPDSKDYF
ncbi:hypothetical protein RhiirC2_777818 [Rhizophagus irregularis]|uniref:Uncharacterized protein n=1 Tax=Rhizophagus irregularis TaxID=588596 RepID=A0A2N1NDE0_9GLOM|nr:hypothetical protein RhiirC2_777818 [Rhizophagus irregularis]